MADYTVARAKHATAGAGAVDRVSFQVDSRVERHYVFVVTSLDGASSPLYVNFSDSADPAVGGDDTYVVLPGKTREFELFNRGVAKVRLICAAGHEYNVEAMI